MSVFISYSHEDETFVNRFARSLVKAKAHVWVAKWELKVGDSLLDRIQKAIGEADALIVVLSKASVSSEWCRKELNAGLLRELDEKQVIVLPVLLEDCSIPLFLKDKLYADFRKDFGKGVKEVLASIARTTSDNRSRVTGHDETTDWSMDYGTFQGEKVIQFTFVQQAKEATHTVVTSLQGFLNRKAVGRLRAYESVGLEWLGQHVMAEFIAGVAAEGDLRVLLSDVVPETRKFVARDKKIGYSIECIVTCRLLGNDPGNDVLIDVGGLLKTACAHMMKRSRKLTEEETEGLARILKEPY